MLRPVRGSVIEGATGVNSDGLKPLNRESFCWNVLALESLINRWVKRRENTMGASLAVSLPAAMPHSICPVAILAAIPNAACKLVPQACCSVMPGVRGDRSVLNIASLARLKSFEWVVTAPATTSSISFPCSWFCSTMPWIAQDNMSILVRSA